MRKRWKEVGLGMLTMLFALLAISGLQIVYKRYLPAGLGPLAVAATFLAAYLAGARWIERRRPVPELTPRRALPELAAGLALGFVLFSTTMAILWAMGVYHPAGWGSTKGLAEALSLAAMAGILEELLFRGILFRLSARIVGTWGALLFTSALFGLAHLGNKAATLSSGIAIMLEAGVLLGAAYALTRRLWLPIGLHIAWNFTEGSIYGMQISGNSAATGLLRGSLSGPSLLTGGAFGPEASIVAVMVCLVTALLLLYRTAQLSRIEPPAWSLSAAGSSSSGLTRSTIIT
ncbi:MAG TPA: type II CAAX endopeptidase family protein [Candidatus Eisenbacteria bacterium]|nr:type II CAAX endopeptidase family protein [Candidatus Eisenbacteria bacterium]